MNIVNKSMNNWLEQLESQLQDLEHGRLLRALKPHEGRLDFSSNDYLSLNASGRIQRMLADIVAGRPCPGPVGSTGSRLIRGHYAEFEEAEDKFARYVGQPGALLFHSGYAANLGALQALVNGRDNVFCDRLAHASLLDGIRLSGARRRYFNHNDLNDLEAKLKKYGQRARAGTRANTRTTGMSANAREPHADVLAAPGRGRDWIVTESIFSMDGDSPDLPALCEIAERFDALIYLDEAHAIGIVGPGGAGLARAQGVSGRIAVTVFPCGKAPGLMGAFVCGPSPLKSFLINHARSFIFSTAQPPLLARLLRDIIDLLVTDEMNTARAHVQRLAGMLRERLRGAGFDVLKSDSQIVPAVVGSESRALELAQKCRSAGLDVRAIRPPSVPAGTSRLRITIQAAHRPEDIEELATTLGDAI